MHDNLLHELSQPFPPSQIEWQVGQLSADHTKAVALASAPLRAYLKRLDAVCGLAWSVTYTPWGDRLICQLTIQGVTRSSTGEPESQATPNERAGAEVQAFKRACALFGLGRDLESLPSPWVAYDAATQQFTAIAQVQLARLVGQSLQTVMPEGQPELEVEVEQAVKVASEATPERTAPDQPQPLAQASAEPAHTSSADAALGELRTRFEETGQDLYGEQWAQVSQHNIERITGGQGQSAVDLTGEQLQKLIDGMHQLKRKRRGKAS